jgi:signal transduction histidine kinase
MLPLWRLAGGAGFLRAGVLELALAVQTPGRCAVMIVCMQNSSETQRASCPTDSLLTHSDAPRRFVRSEPIGEEEARRLVEAERLRLARELHDVVAYGFATISLHAGVAAHGAEAHPERAVEALQAIRTASRDVLGEMRAILGQLRHDDEASEPARGIGRLGQLAENTTRAGVPTIVHMSGRPRPVPVAVDFAVYRIVQEALTNVLRHARGATASVSVSYESRCLVVEVEDNGTGEAGDLASEGSSYGIVGMRERARALGGELRAGPRPGGGFSVCATVPFLGRP